MNQRVAALIDQFRSHFRSEAPERIPAALRQESSNVLFVALLEDDKPPGAQLTPMLGPGMGRMGMQQGAGMDMGMAGMEQMLGMGADPMGMGMGGAPMGLDDLLGGAGGMPGGMAPAPGAPVGPPGAPAAPAGDADPSQVPPELLGLL